MFIILQYFSEYFSLFAHSDIIYYCCFFFCCIAFPPFFGFHISFVNNLYYYCCQTLFRIKMLIIHSFKSNVQIDRELKYIIPQNSQVLSFLFIYTQVAHIRHHNVLGLWYDSLLFYYIKTI